jgi:diaminopimelate decarboxylase
VNEGALIHLDNLDEMFQLEAIATRLNRRVPCALRLNFNTGYTEAWSRFGFNIETGAAADAARRIAASGALELTGLHSHIGTFVLDPRAYASQVKIMCEFMDFAESQTATPIQYIDIAEASRRATPCRESICRPSRSCPRSISTPPPSPKPCLAPCAIARSGPG